MIDFINNTTDPNTGNTQLRATFPNEDRALSPGLFARIQAPFTAEYEAVLVPTKAMGMDQQGRYVFKVLEGKAVRQSIEPGEVHGDLTVIRSGLVKDDLVIVNGLQKVRPGSAVATQASVTQAATAQPASAPATAAQAAPSKAIGERTVGDKPSVARRVRPLGRLKALRLLLRNPSLDFKLLYQSSRRCKRDRADHVNSRRCWLAVVAGRALSQHHPADDPSDGILSGRQRQGDV